MSRPIDSIGLFGLGFGISTLGDITCAFCGHRYNEGADDFDGKNEPTYDDSDSIRNCNFAGLTVCECCYEKIEHEIWERRTQVIKWIRDVTEKNLKRTQEDKALLDELSKEASDE